jgi:hypothetical protein
MDLLKYHRLQDGIAEVLQDDKITSSAIELNAVAFGTENGFVHVMSLDGHMMKSVKVHDRSGNSVSIDGSGSAVARYM